MRVRRPCRHDALACDPLHGSLIDTQLTPHGRTIRAAGASPPGVPIAQGDGFDQRNERHTWAAMRCVTSPTRRATGTRCSESGQSVCHDARLTKWR